MKSHAPHYCHSTPVWKQLVIGLFLIAAYVVAMGLIIASAGGCQDAEVSAAIHRSQQNAAVQVAQVKAAATVKNAKATASPGAHPIAAQTQVIKEFRRPLIISSVISFLLFAVAVGLWIQKIPFAKTAVIVALSVSSLSFIGAVGVAFVPWLEGIALAFGSAGVGFFIYEWIKLKSAGAALAVIEQDVESILGRAGTPAAPLEVTAPAAAAAKPQAAGTATVTPPKAE